MIERALEEANAAAGWLAMLNEDDFSEFGKELFQNLGRKLTEVGLTSQVIVLFDFLGMDSQLSLLSLHSHLNVEIPDTL